MITPLDVKIWTILQEKRQENRKYHFSRGFTQAEEQ